MPTFNYVYINEENQTKVKVDIIIVSPVFNSLNCINDAEAEYNLIFYLIKILLKA